MQRLCGCCDIAAEPFMCEHFVHRWSQNGRMKWNFSSYDIFETMHVACRGKVIILEMTHDRMAMSEKKMNSNMVACISGVTNISVAVVFNE